MNIPEKYFKKHKLPENYKYIGDYIYIVPIGSSKEITHCIVPCSSVETYKITRFGNINDTNFREGEFIDVYKK